MVVLKHGELYLFSSTEEPYEDAFGVFECIDGGYILLRVMFNGRGMSRNCWLPDAYRIVRQADSERNGFVSGDCRSYLSRPGFLEGHESRDLPVAIDRQRIVFPAGCRGRRTGRTVKKRMRTPAIRYPHTGAPGATGLHPERVRVESRTFAFYVRDEIHLLRAEFEVEQLRVLDDSRRRDGLRQRQDAPL